MIPTTAVSASPPISRQAAELAELVELEARWENLRAATSRTAAVRSTTQDLHGMQKAYDAFRASLTAYNNHFPPGHVPELLLNNPLRLGTWCRRMRNLYAQVEQAPQVRYPVQLLEKAYRCAARIAGRTGKACPLRPTLTGDLQTAIQELEALTQWCEDQAGLASSASQLKRK